MRVVSCRSCGYRPLSLSAFTRVRGGGGSLALRRRRRHLPLGRPRAPLAPLRPSRVGGRYCARREAEWPWQAKMTQALTLNLTLTLALTLALTLTLTLTIALTVTVTLTLTQSWRRRLVLRGSRPARCPPR